MRIIYWLNCDKNNIGYEELIKDKIIQNVLNQEKMSQE